jgi:GNAT superfamily N-acetyltransferase
MTAVIERLHDLLMDDMAALVAESEQAGARFVRRLVDEWAAGANRFDRPGEALFAARVDGRLVGVCGLNVDPCSADDRVGRVRHLYVVSAFRRCGVGRQLVAEVVGAARCRFDTLRLSTGNSSAGRLYESLGFRPAEGAVNGATHMKELTQEAGSPAAPRGGEPAPWAPGP